MMNLNVKTMKNFRDNLALWHIADFVLADELCQKQARVKSLQTLIQSNKDMIDRLEKGDKTVLADKDTLVSEIADYESKIKTENEQMTKLREEQTVDLKKGRDLVTTELLDALNEYMADVYSDDVEQKLLDTLVEWFKNNGASDCDVDSVKPYIRAIGVKKASARVKAKTNRHNSAQSKVATIDIFLGAICDEPSMAKLLPIHKWTTIIEKKTSKKTK